MLCRPFKSACRYLHSSRSTKIKPSIKCILQSPEQYLDQSIEVHGWVHSFRQGKKFKFLDIDDGTTSEHIQAVLGPEHASDPALKYGASVAVTGRFIRSTKGTQAYEVQGDSLRVIGKVSSDYPLQNQYASAEHLRSNAHLRSRTQFQSSLMRIKSGLWYALGEYFHKNGFVHVHPPQTTASDCEGTGEAFALVDSEKFFGKKMNLIVSSQLHLEAVARGTNRVWTIGPVHRAEKSATSRHLAEFSMIEAEWCFTESLHEVMDIVESTIKHLTIAASHSKEVRFLRSLKAGNLDSNIDIDERWASCLRDSWPRISYAQAFEILSSVEPTASFVIKPDPESGLQAEHEKYLARHFKGPVFVTNYPSTQKPFYMLETGDGTVECFDLLVPDMGELCGSSLREHRLEQLLAKMRLAGMNEDEMDWYIDLRRYGSTPHGGFGIGWERLIGFLCGISNLKEIVGFPRAPGLSLG